MKLRWLTVEALAKPENANNRNIADLLFFIIASYSLTETGMHYGKSHVNRLQYKNILSRAWEYTYKN